MWSLSIADQAQLIIRGHDQKNQFWIFFLCFSSYFLHRLLYFALNTSYTINTWTKASKGWKSPLFSILSKNFFTKKTGHSSVTLNLFITLSGNSQGMSNNEGSFFKDENVLQRRATPISIENLTIKAEKISIVLNKSVVRRNPWIEFIKSNEVNKTINNFTKMFSIFSDQSSIHLDPSP